MVCCPAESKPPIARQRYSFVGSLGRTGRYRSGINDPKALVSGVAFYRHAYLLPVQYLAYFAAQGFHREGLW
jgi:hypothetical protein